MLPWCPMRRLGWCVFLFGASGCEAPEDNEEYFRQLWDLVVYGTFQFALASAIFSVLVGLARSTGTRFAGTRTAGTSSAAALLQ